MACSIQRLAAVVLASALTASSALAAEQWLKLTSSHFELYTTAGEKKGREAILFFEQVRDFFGKARGNAKPVTTAPVRIIAFRSDKEYKPYRISESADAFYLDGYDRDYIVMRNITEESYPVAVHEFTHLLIKHAGIEVPIWFNEGLADVYSSLKPMGKKVLIGSLIPGRIYPLQQNKWIPFDALTAVDAKSPYYNEKVRAGIFYAESWALVHMLFLSDQYRAQFNKLMAALASGLPASTAFWQTYAKTLEQVQQDLEQYMRGTRFNGMLFDIKLEKSAEEPDIEPASELESGMVLADLLALTSKRDAAKEAYGALAQANPKRWEVEEGLAQLAWRGRNLEEAKKHFARAEELGSTNPRMYFDYSMVLHQTDGQDISAIAALKKAIELDPEYQDAHYYLAFSLMNDGKYQDALDHFKKVKHIKIEQAFAYYHGMAYCDYQQEKWDDAQKAGEAARKYARQPQDIASAEDMLRALTEERERRAMIEQQMAALAAEQAVPSRASEAKAAAERPKQLVSRVDGPGASPAKPSVVGTLRQVDCLGQMLRLHITAAGQKKIALAITDPESVTIKGVEGGTVDLACGPQKGKLVIVEYQNRQDAKLGTVGDVRSIEFQ
ncbi:MAG TPA: tetratricopeptide repeat protein [Bryobacteraceae bacterium]|nr:tetratricopeptide repeat protein [Bryobacteraceae bacterium]HXJ38212.1 tetratricopeptide repeat protein [Bryobacteraceae bacterium]